MKTTYVCYIKSNSSYGRTYDVETKSALKAADMFGRYEGGETVTIYRKRSHKVIDRATYSPEDGGGYYKAYFDEGETF